MIRALFLLGLLHLAPWLLTEFALARRRRRHRRLLALVPPGGRPLGLVRWRGVEVLLFHGADGAVGACGPVATADEAACVRWLVAEGFAAQEESADGRE